jgi:hypothetical protein
MLRRILLVAVAAISTFAVVCSGGGDIEPADSYETLSTALESAGMSVGDHSENKFLFSDVFSVPGIEITASGQELLAFEFATI